MAKTWSYFVEFTFTDSMLGRTYWLPLLVNAENIDRANDIVEATQRALSEKYEVVSTTRPLLETGLSKEHIMNRYHSHRVNALRMLNVKVWRFTDIPNQPWSFMEHVAFIENELPLVPRTIAECLQHRQFPVRILRKGIELDFEEYMLVDVVVPPDEPPANEPEAATASN